MSVDDAVVEMLVDGIWTEVTRIPAVDPTDPDVRVLGGNTSGLAINAGRAGESGRVSPTSLTFTMLDTAALLDGENYASPFYGKVGPGVPVRGRLQQAIVADTFGRSVTGGWGSATSGEAWSTFGAGGTVAAGDWDVAAGVGTHEVSAANAYRVSYLATLDASNVDAAATVTVDLPTGASIHPTLVFRGLSATDYYMARAVISTTGAVTATLVRRYPTGSTSTLTSAVVADLTHALAVPLKIRAQIIDGCFRARVWQGAVEPTTWHAETYEVLDRWTGWAGIRSHVDSGNTNVKPLVFSYDDVTVEPLEIRAITEYVSPAPSWDESSDVTTVAVNTAGIMRRLGEATRPLDSPAYAAIMSDANAATRIAFWPLEEQSGATRISSPINSPDAAFSGEVDFGAYNSSLSAARMLTFGTAGRVQFNVPTYTSTEHKWISLWAIPESSLPADSVLARLDFTGGTITRIELVYADSFDGSLRIIAYSSVGAVLFTGTEQNFSARTVGKHFLLSLEFAQSGVDVSTGILVVDQAGNGLASQTIPAQTIGRFRRGIYGLTDITGASFGMSAIGNDTSAFPNYISPVNGSLGTSGYTGERAGHRMARLFEQEGIPFSILGDPDETPEMGPQSLAATLLDQAHDCADTDQGILYEMRAAAVGLEYRTLRHLCNQVPTFDASYAHLSPGFAPRGDRPGATNDVTAQRDGGSSFRYVIPDGDLAHWSTEPAPAGMGSRPTSPVISVETDDMLPPHAAWRAHLGSWRERRYTAVPFEAARAAFTAADRAALRRVNVGDMVAIDSTGAPAWVTYDEIRALCPGRTERITRFLNTVTFDAIPADQYEAEMVDTSGAYLVSAIDDDDGALLIGTTLGPEFIEITSSDTPYDIQVNGQPMRVTEMTTQTVGTPLAGTAVHADNASLTPTAHASTAAGNLMILTAAIRNSGTGSPVTPTGWRNISTTANLRVMARHYVDGTGNDAPTVTFSGGVAGATTSAVITTWPNTSYALAGVNKSAPNNATQVNSVAVQDIAFPALAVPTGRDGNVILLVLWKQDDWTGVAPPAGFTELVDVSSTLGSDQGIAIYYAIQTTATDIAAGTALVTGGAVAISRSRTIALRPVQAANVVRGIAGTAASAAADAVVRAWRLGVNGL